MNDWQTEAGALTLPKELTPFEATLDDAAMGDGLKRRPSGAALGQVPCPGPGPAAIAPRRAPQAISVEISSLNKSYGERRVLRDIALKVAPGEFVAVIGRSGCGKSTLLRIVAGLEQPDAAPAAPLLRVHGEGVQTPPEVRIMFQEARLLPWRSVAKNVALGLRRDGSEAVALALDSVGLGDRAGDWPLQLSGGQRQRVALARALIHKPGLLLLDEPLGALDALTRIEMQDLLAAVWARERFTALLVTHDVAEAVALADRVVLIENGRVAFEVSVDLPRPRVRGSAAFASLEASILERVLASRGA